MDSAGKITGYKTPGGADTVFPFSTVKGLSVFLHMGRYGGGKADILLPAFDCDSITYKVTNSGTFTIGLTTSYPTRDYSADVSNIASQSLYGYRQVLAQGIGAGGTGTINTKGYKGIYITQTKESSTSSITITYN